MKKAFIITLVIFVASAMITLCCAVALGSGAFKEMLDNSGGIENFLENIEEKIDSIEIDDLDDDNKKIVSTLALDAFEYKKNILKIGCDASEIILVPSQSNELSAKMDVYALTQEERDDYDMHADHNGFDIYVEKLVKTAKSSAKTVIYVPNNVEKLIIDSAVADVTVKNLSFKDIDIKINVGELELENVVADNCKIIVETGEIEIDNNLKINKALTAEVETGELSYELPNKQKAVITYNAELGSVEAEDGFDGYIAFDKDGNKVNSLAKEGRLESAIGIDDAIKVDLNISVGKIEFDQIFG